MLSDRRLKNYASVLWWGLATARRNPFRRGDVVQIRFQSGALRLAEVLHRLLLDRGLNPVPRLLPTPDMEVALFTSAAGHQLDFVSPGEAPLLRRLNGNIVLSAPDSLTHLRAADPGKIGRAALATRSLKRLLEARESRGDYGWTLCMLPTAELARAAGTSTAAYADHIARACFLDSADPVGEWRRVHRTVGRIKQRLDRLGAARFRVESAGTDLEIAAGERRTWAGVSGRNIPSFEVFVSPDWRGTRGVFHADQPSYRSGNIVRGVRLEFKGGRVVRAQAAEGEAFLKRQIAMDRGAAQVGEFSLTDRRLSPIDRFMANTLFDENFGGAQGNVHIALGSSYANTYAGDRRRLTGARKSALGFNDSALHWDLVNTERKRVTAFLRDGTRLTIYEDGEFKI
ncbi:MAG: aminopeptidase [Desulfobacterales bacterium]|jgi:aminopeptidase|nr:aminopeptidase [Desulfobacterales bacterium]